MVKTEFYMKKIIIKAAISIHLEKIETLFNAYVRCE